jgi:hypothetical protein
MKKILGRIPTEEEISLLLDKGAEVEIYMKDGRINMKIGEPP